MEKVIADQPITGFRNWYERLRRNEKRDLLMRLGNPARSTLHRWLDDPGSIRLGDAQIIIDFFQPLFPGVSVQALCDTVTSLRKSKLQQYQEYENSGGSMTLEEWEHDGRFDPSLV